MSRPPDLPDFKKPPLNEVVLGVQFDAPAGYHLIQAGCVWALFSERFSRVEELPPLLPQFETFGPQVSFSPSVRFGPLTTLPHPRFWFLSEDGDELIQFQRDRLLHNWRKVVGKNNEYPRYETIVSKFAAELESLERFVTGIQPQNLMIRQCEISYINHIKGGSLSAGAWLNYLRLPTDPDDFTMTFRRVLRSSLGEARGRLICESFTAVETDGRPFISLTLTARGAPEQPTAESALAFLDLGRETICKTFVDITTDSAHQAWERVA